MGDFTKGKQQNEAEHLLYILRVNNIFLLKEELLTCFAVCSEY